MMFQEAIEAVKAGKCVRRSEWADPIIILALGATIGDDFPADVIYTIEAADDFIYFPWQPTAEDQGAVDWELIEWSRDKGFEQ